MSILNQKIKQFLTREDGPTAVEYAIILGVIVTTCMGSLVFLGDGVRATFEFISNALTI